ncbi:MAG: DUF192 domain-containing protein [Acidimicrobiia bacterium]|nr:DUF192 domain-containing protein [Acidimicrobiia bacterium]
MRALVLAVVVVAAVGCSASSDPEPTAPASSTSRLPTTTAVTSSSTTTTTSTTDPPPQAPAVPDQLVGVATTIVSLDGRQLLVAVADTPQLRRNGLMFVEDLVDLDGMLFLFESETSTGFWMKNTVIPLDIAFFDDGGRYVDGFAMEPCDSSPCPTYFPEGSYRYALEMAAGTMPADLQVLDVGVS